MLIACLCVGACTKLTIHYCILQRLTDRNWFYTYTQMQLSDKTHEKVDVCIIWAVTGFQAIVGC